MFDAIHDDGLNPKFVYLSPVFLDELSPAGSLPHDHLSAHITAAVDAFHTGEGCSRHCTGDEVSVIRDIAVEVLNPVTSSGPLRVDVWLDRLDESSCTYGFLCSSEDGLTPYARGERTVMKLDPALLRPSPWSPGFVEEHSKFLRTLHSCV
jgi:acyl-CoA thioester hydrolase